MRRASLAPAYKPWTLRGRLSVLGGLHRTHRSSTAPRRQPAVGPTPRAARHLCHPRLACSRGQLAVLAGAKMLTISSIPSLSFVNRAEQADSIVCSIGHRRRTPPPASNRCRQLLLYIPSPHRSFLHRHSPYSTTLGVAPSGNSPWRAVRRCLAAGGHRSRARAGHHPKSVQGRRPPEAFPRRGPAGIRRPRGPTTTRGDIALIKKAAGYFLRSRDLCVIY
jgi:hypothetical protein